MSFARRSALLAVLPAIIAAQKLDAGCENVVLFMARGNDAPYHDGRTTPFLDATCAKLNAQGMSCDYIDVQFDVTYGGDYCTQVAEGARNGIAQITAFNAKCPNSLIVPNGYSEGAQVNGDILGGPGGCEQVSAGIDSNSPAGKAIAAATLWGDVRHTANQPYNVLDGAGLEAYPRKGTDLALLNRYSSVLRSYCAAGDPVCAGGNVVADHLNYFEKYTEDASDWVVSMINKRKPASSSSAAPSSTLATSASSSVPASSSAAPSSSGAASSAASSVVPSSGVASSSGSKPTASVASYSTVPTVPTAPYPTGVKPSAGHPSGVKPSGGYAHGGKPSGPATSGMNPSYTQSHPGSHPPFPAPTPYENCVVTYEVVTKYV